MSGTSAITVRVARRFSAAPERVFDAWLVPEQACRFLFATESGQIVRAEIEARVGGRFVIVDRRGGEDVEHAGEYLEIDRPRCLAFTLCVEKYARDADRVSIEIAPLQTGCELTLTHEMGPDRAEYVSRVEAGWAGILDGLAATLATSSVCRDAWRLHEAGRPCPR